ncbi:MAG: ATP-binding cassette domain-containing protein [Chloroflexi bacterium]|jgi:ATP-binding cassette subfamily B protein|nr:ATP-binding cassette domain-containing protein [Chloroflexota bacterium]
MTQTRRTSPRNTHLALLARYLKPQRGAVLLLSLLIIGGIALQLANPQLVRHFLDGVESGQELGELVKTALLFIAIALLAQALMVAATYVGEGVAWTATNELRADLALHCLKLDMTFHKAHKPGELIERVDGDVNQLATFFSQLLIQLVSNFLLITGVIILLWMVDWRVGAIITLLALLGMVALYALNARLVPRWQRVRQVDSDFFGYLEEWLNGTEMIRSNGAAPFIMGRLYRLFRQRWRSMQNAMRLNLGVMSLPIIVPTLAYIAAYLWGSALFRGSVLTIGTVYLIFYYIDVIKNPLWVIQRQVQDLQKAAASINRISDLFAQQPTLLDSSLDSLPLGALAIQFDGVSFYYADDPDQSVLTDLSFTLEAGQTLGLLGRTGSGKTTMTRLLFRFYDPTSGCIRLGDAGGDFKDVRHLSQAELRRRIGLVTQEVQLFHASVRDNLTLFDESIDDGQIVAALNDLGLIPWLESLPGGLDTRLEAGDSLSAGEAQLLALARVFLADPGLVILDEASSRLDPATEAMLNLAVEKLIRGRTAVIIAHRLATVQRAGKIMILSEGRIVEVGRRTALMADPNTQFSGLLRAGLEEALV